MGQEHLHVLNVSTCEPDEEVVLKLTGIMPGKREDATSVFPVWYDGKRIHSLDNTWTDMISNILIVYGFEVRICQDEKGKSSIAWL